LEIQIHQQKGEVIKGVDGGQRFVELNGVIERRLALIENDVCQMQIAVAATDKTAYRPLIEDACGAVALTPELRRQAINPVPETIGSRETTAD
jgi:hypothetical protein